MERDNGAGILRPGSKELRVPSRLEEMGEGGQSAHPHHVMLVIVLLALAFIAVVAYFVSQMPVKQP